MVSKVLFSSKNGNWTTPKWLYDLLDGEFNFDFDPCPLNPTFDGLKIEWGKRNYVNPPYGRGVIEWIRKGFEEWCKGKLVVFLLPVRTDTFWFHEYLYPEAEIRFIKGRLKFGGAKNSAPFPSMVCVLK